LSIILPRGDVRIVLLRRNVGIVLSRRDILSRWNVRIVLPRWDIGISVLTRWDIRAVLPLLNVGIVGSLWNVGIICLDVSIYLIRPIVPHDLHRFLLSAWGLYQHDGATCFDLTLIVACLVFRHTQAYEIIRHLRI